MSVQEIDNPELLTGIVREKIVKTSGKTVEDLNKLLFVYKQSLIVHTWLQEKWVLYFIYITFAFYLNYSLEFFLFAEWQQCIVWEPYSATIRLWNLNLLSAMDRLPSYCIIYENFLFSWWKCTANLHTINLSTIDFLTIYAESNWMI